MAGKKKTTKTTAEAADEPSEKRVKVSPSEDSLNGSSEDHEEPVAGGDAGKTEDKAAVVNKEVDVEPTIQTPQEKPENGKASSDVAEETKPDVSDAPVEVTRAPDDAGRLLICGGTNWDLIGRKELPKSAAKTATSSQAKNLWGPHVWGEKIRVREAISSCCACHSFIITTEGKVMAWGRNDKGQLGLGDLVTRDTPVLVKGLEGHNIVSIACGRGHTLFLSDKGVVFACGENKMGQLGLGNQTAQVLNPTKISYAGKPIVRIAAGGEFSMCVDAFGGLYTFGSPEHGQLGHNSEGKYFTSGNKLSFHCETTPRRVVVFIEKTREGHVIPVDDVTISEIAAGVNHALAVDTKKRCFSWGFAGYGRLGHSETKNELIPRNIKSFDYAKRGAKKVWAGSTFSIALDESGNLFFWGQSKSSGEATMYPKTIQDLCGWNIRTLGCANKSIAVAADNSLITWGPSPTYGELGYGENKAKSSTIPQEVKLLKGIYVKKVYCGFGHTLMVARDETPEEVQLIEKLPQWP